MDHVDPGTQGSLMVAATVEIAMVVPVMAALVAASTATVAATLLVVVGGVVVSCGC